MSLVSVWLQNRHCVQELNDDTLFEYSYDIIQCLGGIRSLMNICLSDQYTLSYQQQNNLSPLLNDLVRDQRKQYKQTNEIHTENSSFIDINILSLNKYLAFNFYQFLNKQELYQLKLTNHKTYQTIIDYNYNHNNKYFGPKFDYLLSNDNEYILKQLNIINNNITKYGTNYMSKICFPKIDTILLSLALYTNDYYITDIAIKCIVKLMTFAKVITEANEKHFSVYYFYKDIKQQFRTYKHILIDILSQLKQCNANNIIYNYIPSDSNDKFSITNTNNYKDTIRNITINIMYIFTHLLHCNCYIPSENEATQLCKILIENVLTCDIYKYDILIKTSAFNLMNGILNCNNNGMKLSCDILIKNMIHILQNGLEIYMNYFKKEWVYYIKEDTANRIIFISKPNGIIHATRFNTKQEIITNYCHRKYITFGICNSKNYKDIKPYFSHHLIQQVLCISEMLIKFNIYMPIKLNSDIIADIIGTLYIDNFNEWKSMQIFKSDYELRAMFLMNIMRVDLNILFNDRITRYLSSLKATDIDRIFWLVANSNVINSNEIIMRFFGMMSDLTVFVKECKLYNYQMFGLNAFIELMKMKYKNVGIHKICEIINKFNSVENCNRIIRFIFNDSKCIKYLEDIMCMKNKNVFLGFYLCNKLLQCVFIAKKGNFKYEKEKEIINKLCYNTIEKNENILDLPCEIQSGLVVDEIDILNNVMNYNKNCIELICSNENIIKCIIDNISKSIQKGIPYYLLMSLTRIIKYNCNVKQMKFIRGYTKKICSNEQFIVCWINSVMRYKHIINSPLTPSKSVFIATNYILKEYKRIICMSHNIIQNKSKLWNEFKLFLIENQIKYKSIVDEILLSVYPVAQVLQKNNNMTLYF